MLFIISSGYVGLRYPSTVPVVNCSPTQWCTISRCFNNILIVAPHDDDDRLDHRSLIRSQVVLPGLERKGSHEWGEKMHDSTVQCARHSCASRGLAAKSSAMTP